MWMQVDSQSLGVTHLIMIPLLLMAFAFPPAGMLAYLLFLRPIFSRNASSKGLPRTAWKLE